MISESRFSCSLTSGYFLYLVLALRSTHILSSEHCDRRVQGRQGMQPAGLSHRRLKRGEGGREGMVNIPLCKPVIQRCRVDSQHDDEVDPAAGEEVAGVPVDDAPAGLTSSFYGVEELFVRNPISQSAS